MSEAHAAAVAEGARTGIERLELRIERLNVTIRFTFAFHARQVRFERDDGTGYQPLFPETFSFHSGRHDPTELSLQLDDLLRSRGGIARYYKTRLSGRQLPPPPVPPRLPCLPHPPRSGNGIP